MGEYSKFISEKRRSVPTPADMVKDGKCVFGTFETEFQTMDMLAIDGPTPAPNAMNHLKYSCWEATEVNFDEGLLLTACSDMGIYGAILTIFYDKRTKKVSTWNYQLRREDGKMAGTLLNGSVSEAAGPGARVVCVNDFQDGKAHVEGSVTGDAGTLEYSLDLSRLSKPSIVSIPFEDPAVRHRPLYTQKDLFSAVGTLTINGETLHTNAKTTAIIDDHKGYYPDDAHYDWLTTMGVHAADGVEKWLGFNLTRNQSIDQDAYNENLIWLEKAISLLPPVQFTRSVPTIDFEDYALWQVKDEHGMVDIKFHVYGVTKLIAKQPPVIDMEYFIAFGELEGYILDEDGKKYVLDGMIGMGEDKTLSIHL
ncbi:MAG: DUF2804 family protein [Oscillospiraceae bacterium]|nr:DUF2804 family protein [Oscillospiraceae bacterium]